MRIIADSTMKSKNPEAAAVKAAEAAQKAAAASAQAANNKSASTSANETEKVKVKVFDTPAFATERKFSKIRAAIGRIYQAAYVQSKYWLEYTLENLGVNWGRDVATATVKEKGGVVIVAQGANGEVLGSIQAVPFAIVMDSHGPELDSEIQAIIAKHGEENARKMHYCIDFVVDPSVQKGGVGTMLMDEYAKWAAKNGYVGIIDWTSNVAGNPMLKLYETLGYEVVRNQDGSVMLLKGAEWASTEDPKYIQEMPNDRIWAVLWLAAWEKHAGEPRNTDQLVLFSDDRRSTPTKLMAEAQLADEIATHAKEAAMIKDLYRHRRRIDLNMQRLEEAQKQPHTQELQEKYRKAINEDMKILFLCAHTLSVDFSTESRNKVAELLNDSNRLLETKGPALGYKISYAQISDIHDNNLSTAIKAAVNDAENKGRVYSIMEEEVRATLFQWLEDHNIPAIEFEKGLKSAKKAALEAALRGAPPPVTAAVEVPFAPTAGQLMPS